MKQKIGGIFATLLEMLVGVLLLINPVGFTSGIIIGAGILMLVAGIYCVIQYFRKDAQTAKMEQDLFKGLMALLLGFFCTTQSAWLVAVFPLLTILYGIVILISGLGKIQWTVDCIRQKRKRWFLPVISAVVSIACGIVILSRPFSSTAVLWMFTGITIIVEALLDLIAVLFGKSAALETESE